IGARLSVLSQSELYKAIRHHHKNDTRKNTHRAVKQALDTIEATSGSRPPPSQLWLALKKRKHKTLTQKWCAFNWKALHQAHKVGEYWLHTRMKDSRMPCTECNAPAESLEHILLECRVSHQELVWDLVKSQWELTGREWPCINMGLILGISAIQIRDPDGKVNHALTRLFQILVSESCYLIWCLRCEWRIGREANPMRRHTVSEVTARWQSAINKRLRMDWKLTSRAIYKKKALPQRLVARTWQLIAPNLQYINEKRIEGVLVGMGIERRPPGRNR
ncbi:hypothetical protein DFP72DRAFT_796246, partial [Ephemerocybe angulata]